MSTPDPEWSEFVQRMGSAFEQAAKLAPVTVAPTPRERVWSCERLTLWRYGTARASRLSPPLLVVYSLVNRPYLLDLQADRSDLIGSLVALGHSVYLIDWGSPLREDRGLRLEDYVCRYIGGCVEEISRQTRVRALDLLGVCQGGTFALCYAALKPARVRRLVTMVTPVDFGTPGDVLAAYSRALNIDGLVALYGNIPGEFLRVAFASLKPLGNTLGKFVALADAGGDAVRLSNYLRMERWIADSPDQAGTAFAEFVQRFYRDNALVLGTLKLNGRKVELGKITMPLLNIYALRDHLVPPASSTALRAHVRSKSFRELAVDSGHIGVYVGARASREVPGAIAAFLGSRRAGPGAR